MARGLKLGLGIPAVVLGLLLTITGGVLMAVIGPDGMFTLPENSARSGARAIVFDALSFRGLSSSGSLSVTIDLALRDAEGAEEIFAGIGPSDAVADYLDGVATERLVQVDWPGGVKTERVGGPSSGRQPEAPGEQRFWAAQATGVMANLTWVARSGDWTIVLMNADATRGIDVVGSGSVTIPVLGPASVVVLVLGLVLLGVGIALTISGARMPSSQARRHPPAPSAARAAPPRPDHGP